MRRWERLVLLNGVEFEFCDGQSLGELVEKYNQSRAKVDFKSCVVVVNGTAVPTEQAEGWKLSDGETIFVVPKLDGG